jgi:hypothetical protein
MTGANFLIAAVIASALAGCALLGRGEMAPVESEKPLTHTPIEFSGEPTDFPSAKDQTRCTDAGGMVSQGGLLGGWSCVVPYADAGMACTDADQCLGACYADDNADQPPMGEVGATGTCQPNDSPFGCHGRIVDGTLQGVLCVD